MSSNELFDIHSMLHSREPPYDTVRRIEITHILLMFFKIFFAKLVGGGFGVEAILRVVAVDVHLRERRILLDRRSKTIMRFILFYFFWLC